MLKILSGNHDSEILSGNHDYQADSDESATL